MPNQLAPDPISKMMNERQIALDFDLDIKDVDQE